MVWGPDSARLGHGLRFGGGYSNVISATLLPKGHNSTWQTATMTCLAIPIHTRILCKTKGHLPILDELRKRLSEITQDLAPHSPDELLCCRKRALFRREKGEEKVDAFLAPCEKDVTQEA
jgi:hypothetical protein